MNLLNKHHNTDPHYSKWRSNIITQDPCYSKWHSKKLYSTTHSIPLSQTPLSQQSKFRQSICDCISQKCYSLPLYMYNKQKPILHGQAPTFIKSHGVTVLYCVGIKKLYIHTVHTVERHSGIYKTLHSIVQRTFLTTIKEVTIPSYTTQCNIRVPNNNKKNKTICCCSAPEMASFFSLIIINYVTLWQHGYPQNTKNDLQI